MTHSHDHTPQNTLSSEARTNRRYSTLPRVRDVLKSTAVAGAGVVLAVSGYNVLTGNDADDDSHDKSPYGMACSSKTEIDPAKTSGSVNGDIAVAATYQVNNAFGAVEDGSALDRITSGVPQAKREALARSIEPKIEAIDNPNTAVVETGKVCVSFDDTETSMYVIPPSNK